MINGKRIMIYAIATFIFMMEITIASCEKMSENGKTLYVGGSGEGNYTSIQDAIDNASDGDTIMVYPGKYNESIEINKTLFLMGKAINETMPIIHSNKFITVNITAKKCVFKFFTVMNNYAIEDISYTINVLSDGNVLENNIIIGGYAGIRMFYSSNNLIKNNTIKKTYEQGLILDHSHHNVVERNKLVYNEWDAITLFASNNNTISRNEVKWNECGISVQAYSKNNLIIENNASENTNYGITVQGASYNKIIGNYVYKNKEWCGISILSSFNTISENVVVGNNWIGIDIEGKRNVISKNVIKNSKVGLFLEGFGENCRKNVIINNNFIGNGKHAWFDGEQYLPPSNLFLRNYWDDWHLPFPRPIFGIWEIHIFFRGIDIPWLNFDWMPRVVPYGGKK